MSNLSLTYFYSAHSAYAYIGHQAFVKLAGEAGRSIIHKPFNLMKCLNNIGYQPLEERTEKTLNYQFSRQRDRWAEFRGVQIPKVTPSSHNNGAEIADLVLLAASDTGIDVTYLSYVFMQNHWINNLDLSDETAVHATLLGQGLDAIGLIEKANLEETKNLYEQNTAEAIELSVFGSPTYFVDTDMFYGQDNLQLVERALKNSFG